MFQDDTMRKLSNRSVPEAEVPRPPSYPGLDIEKRLLFASDDYGWSGAVIRGYELAPHADLIEMPHNSGVDSILLQIQGPHTLYTVVDGHVWQGRTSPGSVCILPRDTHAASRWTASTQVLHVYLDSALVAHQASGISRGDPERVELTWQFNIRDPLIQQIGLALKADLEAGCPAGPLYAETLAQALALHLLRHYSSLAVIHDLASHACAAPELGRVIAYIDDQLDQPLALADLAAVAGISPSYLIRQFKQATGLAPHQYLVQRRVQRARELLAAGTLPIGAVAAAVGFADQSHLDRHFKRLLGVSPKDVRPVGSEHPRSG